MGKNLQIQEGSKLRVYENVFVSGTVITRNVDKCDYIFYQPLKEATNVGMSYQKSPEAAVGGIS